jgi:alpha-galactosidase
MGAHVGPASCHITGRRLTMAVRVATALFGHLGMELDLRELDSRDAADLAAGVALYKMHRALIHGGDLFRLDAEAGVTAGMIVAPDQSEALLSWTVVTEAPGYFGAPLCLAGLDAAADYRISRVWPPRLAVEWPATEGAVLAGSLLMRWCCICNASECASSRRGDECYRVMSRSAARRASTSAASL